MVYRVGCVLRRAAVLGLLVYGVHSQCVAGTLHQHSTASVYLTHDGQLLRALAQRAPGTYWFDGYRMIISKQTQICWHDESLPFGPILNWAAQPVPKLKMTLPCDSAPPTNLVNSAWLQYLGSQEYDSFRPSINVVVTRIDVWNGESNGNPRFSPHTAAGSAWHTLCASAPPHELSYPNEDPIEVVCDTKVNSYVENIYLALLKPSAITADVSTASQEIPNFYVVKPFQVNHNYDFEAIDGSEASCATEGGTCTYKRPHAHATVREIVYAPDGSVLIPDMALAHLKNDAQLAALLSFSLAAKDQNLIGRLFSVQNFKGNVWTLSYKASGRQNDDWMGEFIWNLNNQVLRIGIRQMYLAGFDVRYAPFAWAVERGKRIKGPVNEPNTHMPWYADYGFNAINQLYSNADYSKLKRGEAEYAQFLDELRKADPEAFEVKK